MKKLWILVVLFPLNFVLARSAAAILKHGIGANGLGLGGTYSAIVKDPSALYWNPAGLGHINGETKIQKRVELSKEAEKAFDEKFEEFMSDNEATTPQKPTKKEEPTLETIRSFEMQVYATASSLSLGRQLGFTGIAFTAPGGTYGVGLLAGQVSGIQGYDATGNPTGTQAYQSMAGFLGYAREAGGTRVGFSFTGIYENIAGHSLTGGGLNVGAQVTPFPLIDLGIDVQNLLGAIQSQATPGASWDKLDTILRFALAISTPPPSSSMKLLLGFSTNLDDSQTEGLVLNIGLAISLSRNLYIMGGFDNGNFAGGLGALFFRRLRIAYTLNRDPLGIDFQHTVEINLRF